MKLAIINYHYIRESFLSPYPGVFGVTPDSFFSQLKLLQQVGTFISQEDLVKHITYGTPLPTKALMITFDDGLSEQYENALPVLQKLNIPATFYVNSSILTNRKILNVHKIHFIKSMFSEYDFLERIKKFIQHNNIHLDFESLEIKATGHYVYDTNASALIKYILNFELNYEVRNVLIDDIFSSLFPGREEEMFSKLYMSSIQIKSIANLGYIGSHGHDHLPIGLLSEEDQACQLKQSKKILEDFTQQEMHGISFPYGSFEASNVCESQIESAGYVYGLTIEKAINTLPLNNYFLARLDCNMAPFGKDYKYTDNNIFNHYASPVWRIGVNV